MMAVNFARSGWRKRSGWQSFKHSVRHLTNGERPLPASSQVVVCGGGAIGCSVAYHLAKVGFREIVLLEKGSLGCGTTWHAAGLVPQVKGSHAEIRMRKYGVKLYSEISQETGLDTSWKGVGSLLIASNEGRLTSLKRTQCLGRLHGVAAEIVSPTECSKLCPLIRVEDLVGGLWVPSDGNVIPTDVVQSLTKGAKMKGAKIFEKVSVEKIEVRNGRVHGVKTNRGDISCEVFVNCAGQWSREVGMLSSPPVAVPLHSAEHFYIVTKPMKGVDPMMPVVRDPCGHFYLREWNGGLLAGGFEPQSKPCFHDGVPSLFEFQLLPEDWEHFQALLEPMLHRTPILAECEIRQMVNGPESFTPDHDPVIGEVPEISNYYVAAGLNSGGIALAAGVGKELSEWIAGGEPPEDMWDLDIRRMGPHNINKAFLNDRTIEIVGEIYAMPWPKKEKTMGRKMKMSPFYDRMDALGACWGEKMGWERPNWFARNSKEVRSHSQTFKKPHWFDNVQEEHTACRESVALFDITSCSRFEINGSRAEDALQQLCSNNVAVPVGHIVDTGILNKHGGFESDCTLVRLEQDKYLLVTGASQYTHDKALLNQHLPSSVKVKDVTSCYSGLAVMGPRSREVLQRLTRTSLDNSNFPTATAKEIDLGYARGVFALRNTEVGELGWELYVPTEYALGVYEKLIEAGKEFGLKHAGVFAMDGLRLEKGYKWWGTELDAHTSPLEAGLGELVDLNKGDFTGKTAIVKQREAIYKMLGTFTLNPQDGQMFPWGKENIYRNGELVGYVTSAAFGHTIGKHICMGYVKKSGGEPITQDYLLDGKYEIEVAGEHYQAEISCGPLYDPQSLKINM